MLSMAALSWSAIPVHSAIPQPTVYVSAQTNCGQNNNANNIIFWTVVWITRKNVLEAMLSAII